MTSYKLSRRNFSYSSKVKLLKNQPLPEPADSLDCTANSSDSMESCATIIQSAASRCDKDDDDLDWQHSTCDSSLLGQSSSSFMSWADDVELEMTQKMQHLWEEIDSFLYEEDSASSSLPPEQVKECEQWKNKFPHLRVVGHRVLTKHGCDDSNSIHVPAEFEEVMPCGHKSPGVFGEKLNSSTECSHTKSTVLIAPRADWRRHETSRGHRNSVPCMKSAKYKRGMSKMFIDPRNK